ncbi:unnamed protein product [Prorocentrum cordatum]|uniref:Kinesin motor domain-containing protein n=1 Tax=Prorocentrum cordatum TaxID=2364126 RepID=A0ABN9QKP6_9DINO|nr:unnamed protein product [Polarella glacialis]
MATAVRASRTSAAAGAQGGRQSSKLAAAAAARALGALSAARALGVPPAEEADDSGAGIKVCVRVRPFISEEIEGDRSGGKTECCIEMPTETTTVMRREDEERTFEFDRCYWSHSRDHHLHATQRTLQEELGETMLTHAVRGFNNCIFAYGQTGSGKSYSVLGGPGEDRGLLPRIVEGLFRRFAEMPEDVKKKTLVSFMEIYNEEIHDLLCDRGGGRGTSKACQKLEVRLHPTLGLTIPGLKESPVDSCESVMQLVSMGKDARMTSATAMNVSSSRSHCIFTFKTSLVEPDGTTKMSQTHLVDLAGSERVSRTKAEGDRLKEGAAINKALSTLARVISELARSGKNRGKPPFRDSKLTHVLKESLCGNSKTVMMAAISPSAVDFDETLSTMKFCQQVKLVQTKAVANTTNENGIEAMLRREAEDLRARLAAAEAHAANPSAVTLGGQSAASAGLESIAKEHCAGRMSLLKQRLEQAEQLSKFYGDGYDKWMAEEQLRIKRRASVRQTMLDSGQLEQLRQFAEMHERGTDGASSAADDSGSDDDCEPGPPRSEYVLCRCLTKPAVAAGHLDDDTSTILVAGPIARELQSALAHGSGGLDPWGARDPQKLIDRTAEQKTELLARCWSECVEAESAVSRLSKEEAPKLLLIPHVAVRPDEIDLTCEVIVSAEYCDDGIAISEWFKPRELEQITKWLRDSLHSAGLEEGDHGTDDNAWETAVSTVLERPTRGGVKKMQSQLSMAPRLSTVNMLTQEIEAERRQLTEAKLEAATTEQLRRELAQQRAANDRMESQASEAVRAHLSLVSEVSEELQGARRRAQQLQVTSENQRGGLALQRKQLDAAQREAAEAAEVAEGLCARVEALHLELRGAEHRLAEGQRGLEDARELRARLGDAEGRLAFAETQVGEADRLRAECQEAQGRLRILQGRCDEAQRLRDGLDRAQAQLAELANQPAPQGGGARLEQRLRAELGAAESRLQLEGQRATAAEQLRSALAAATAELREEQGRSSQAGVLGAELAAMQRSLREQRRRAEEGDLLRGEFQAVEQELSSTRAAVREADRLRTELGQAHRQLGVLRQGAAEAAERAQVELAGQLELEADALRSERARCGEAAAEAHALRSELGALRQEALAERRRSSTSSGLSGVSTAASLSGSGCAALPAEKRAGPDAAAWAQVTAPTTQRLAWAAPPPGHEEAHRLRAELAAAEVKLGSTLQRLAAQEALARAHDEASSALLEARGEKAARARSLAGEIASSFAAAIEAIDAAKKEPTDAYPGGLLCRAAVARARPVAADGPRARAGLGQALTLARVRPGQRHRRESISALRVRLCRLPRDSSSSPPASLFSCAGGPQAHAGLGQTLVVTFGLGPPESATRAQIFCYA